MPKDYDPVITSRINIDDYNLLIELAVSRGERKSILVRNILHKHCEEVRVIRRNLVDQNKS